MSDLSTIPPDEDQPEHVLDIYLFPGDIYWGDSQTRIITILGSCVSITLWHPQRREGGMCHFLLPSRNGLRTETLSGRYGEEEKSLGGLKTIGTTNVERARIMLEKSGISVQAIDAGGALYRKIVFQLWNGNVWVRSQKNSQPSV